MHCECCERARKFSGFNRFSPACLHCGARIIQHLGTLQIGRTECSERRRSALADWLAWGHSEAEIRRLAKGPLAMAPEQKLPTVASTSRARI